MVLVEGNEDDGRCAHDVILGHEAPETGVERVVTVVALHPVVVHLEGVAGRGLAVDKNLVALDLKGVALIVLDAALIERQILKSQIDLGTLLGNPDGSVIGVCPAVVIAHGIGDNRLGGVGLDALNNLYPRFALQCLLHFGSERQHIFRGTDEASCLILIADAQFLEQVVTEGGAVGLDIVAILHILGLRHGLVVDIDDAVLDLQCLSG